MEHYKSKYLKYKMKYIKLKGGGDLASRLFDRMAEESRTAQRADWAEWLTQPISMNKIPIEDLKGTLDELPNQDKLEYMILHTNPQHYDRFENWTNNFSQSNLLYKSNNNPDKPLFIVSSLINELINEDNYNIMFKDNIIKLLDYGYKNNLSGRCLLCTDNNFNMYRSNVNGYILNTLHIHYLYYIQDIIKLNNIELDVFIALDRTLYSNHFQIIFIENSLSELTNTLQIYLGVDRNQIEIHTYVDGKTTLSNKDL